MAAPPRILIAEARFYTDIADEMLRGALAALDRAGAVHERVTVPGSFEIPGAIRIAHAGGEAGAGPRFDGYVALGCVIRGETSHYDYVSGESARGLQDLAIRHAIALGYGILTVDSEAQAWERARIDRGNKGRDAVEACLAMIALRRRFGLASQS